MGCFKGARVLRAGEGAGFAIAGEHCLAEPLLADSGLAQPDPVTARDSFVLPYVRAPPWRTGHQVGFQDRAQLGGWATPGILEALIPGRMQGHGGTEEVPG
jgi:hypothetical protein